MGLPTFPLCLGTFCVPPSFLRICNSVEAELAATEDRVGLVVCFRPVTATTSEHGVKIICFRVSTYSELSDTDDESAVAVCEIQHPSAQGAAEVGGDDFLTVADMAHLHRLVNIREHLTRWPSHRWWSGVAGIEDELASCESHGPNCKCNLDAKDACRPGCEAMHEHRFRKNCCGPSCRTLRLASCELHIYKNLENPTTAVEPTSRYSARLALYLEAGAFDLDARLDAGALAANFSTEDPVHAYALAAEGERSVSQRSGRKELLALVRRLATHGATSGDGGLECVSCHDTLNGYRGTRREEMVDGAVDGPTDRAGVDGMDTNADSFGAVSLLECVSKRGPENAEEVRDPMGRAALAMIRPHLRSTLHPFQARGVAWMVAHEADVDSTATLHPAWMELSPATAPASPDPGPPPTSRFYLHSYTGEASMRFFPAPKAGTCGGMLCDEVGLGKSLQVLACILARPPPPGWATRLPLPRVTASGPVPIKASLLVAPAALLAQWRSELSKHIVPGALTYSTYVGLAQAPPPAVEAAPPVAVAAAKRARTTVARYQPSSQSDAATTRAARAASVRCEGQPVGGDGEGMEAGTGAAEEMELLAVTFEGLFQREGLSVDVGSCDLVFCSFETLREELKALHRTGRGAGSSGSSGSSGGSTSSNLSRSPLAQLGFWRIILDEAQVVSNSASAAAVMASTLWRRHAWVVTGTPVNARLSELQGLLAFLDARPFADAAVFNALVLSAFEKRGDTSALLRMRTLLAAHLLRRTKSDPHVAQQLQIPPLEWIQVSLTLDVGERAAYDAALADLRTSYEAFARAVDASSNSREAQARLDESRRRRGLEARDYTGAGALSLLQQARKLGELNGALTRVRQMLCSPFAVNAAKRAAAHGEASVLASTVRLPQKVILERLVAQAVRDRENSAVALLRAKAALYMAHVALATDTLQVEPKAPKVASGGTAAAALSADGAAPAAVHGASQKARGKRKASLQAEPPPVAPSQGSSGSHPTRSLTLPAGCEEAAVFSELEALATKSKEGCAQASEDDVVQRVLEVRRQCQKCQRTPETVAKGGGPGDLEATENKTAGEALNVLASGEALDTPEADASHGSAAPAGTSACLPSSSGTSLSHSSAPAVGCSSAECSKGGAHIFRVVAPRRWAVLRTSLRKLYLGTDAPWDADDEREAKAAAAAERRRVVQDEEGKVIKSRRQSRNNGVREDQESQKAAAAACAPTGWERPAKRHPALASIFEVWRRSGTATALKEGAATVEAATRTLREKTSNENFLRAKLERFTKDGQGGAASKESEAAAAAVVNAADRSESRAENTEEDRGEAAEAQRVVAFEAETCPICFDDRCSTTAWVVTPCGHSGCYECILMWVEERGTCPVCKLKDLAASSLYEVEPPPPPPDASDTEVRGDASHPGDYDGPSISTGTGTGTSASSYVSVATPGLGQGLDRGLVREYGTKIAALVQVAQQSTRRGDRIVVFSSWTRLLRVAADALRASGIPCASLVGSATDKQEALRRFGALQEDDCMQVEGSGTGGAAAADAVVLLVPLFGGASGAGGSGAAGLNLQVASVAVLLEPSLQPGIEAQAVGRICRIGQEKPTQCVRLVVSDSIEPNILQWQSRRLGRGDQGHGALSLSDFVHVLGRRTASAPRSRLED